MYHVSSLSYFAAKYVDTKLKAGNKVSTFLDMLSIFLLVCCNFLRREHEFSRGQHFVFQEATEEELERLMDKIMVLFRFIHGNYFDRLSTMDN